MMMIIITMKKEIDDDVANWKAVWLGNTWEPRIRRLIVQGFH